MKKWWVKLLLVLGVVLLALAILITTSSVHSKNTVERYKDQLRAAGEKLDFNELLPAHIDPDSPPRLIRAVRGVGYAFTPTVEVVDPTSL